jgi:hypothetical protein
MKKIALLLLLFLPLHKMIPNGLHDLEIQTLNVQLSNELVYLSQEVRQTILELKYLLPTRKWSTPGKILSLDIQNDGNIALYEHVDALVGECLEACTHLQHDQKTALQAALEKYQALLHSGKAHLIFSERDNEQSQTRGCGGMSSNVKKICKLAVRCLSIQGSFYVNGVDFSVLTALAGAIGATGPAGVQGIAGVLGAVGAAGPAGAAGIAGAIGAIGAAGAAGIQGAPGIPGIAGIGGILGYASACNTSAQTIVPDGSVTFDTPGLSLGVTPPIVAGSTVTIITTGVYFIQYSVRGRPSTLVPPSALQFQLITPAIIGCATYASDVQSISFNVGDPYETEVVNGFVIAPLAAGDILQLQNITNDSGDSVTLTGTVVGTTTIAVNASILVMRLA